jgi:diaminohydroxyphosphoribosylaminopyrimidine deaminase / 5-amino-6-(5-phosphoribosylamino)uracil reductase
MYYVSRIRLPEVDFLNNLIGDLHQRKIQSLFVEGGTHTLNTFIDASLWDEARIFTSREKFGKGVPSPEIKGNLYKKIDIQDDSVSILHR